MVLPLHEQFPYGSIIQLESAEQEDAGYILAQDIDLAEKTGDPELIEEIRALWDGEEWDDIVQKARVEGSTWYVWWMDGVRKYILRHRAPSKSSPTQDHARWYACSNMNAKPRSSSRRSSVCRMGTSSLMRLRSCISSG